MTVMSNGDLVAGGAFQRIGGIVAKGIARWNGVSWSPLGNANLMLGAPSNRGVRAMVELPNGDLIVGGGFDVASGAVADGIARWDGSSWSSLGTGTNWAVLSLAVLANGDVVAGGGFSAAGGVAANNVARWDGMSWSAMGAGTSGFVHALAALPNNDVVAGGGIVGGGLQRWNGSSWSWHGAGTNGSPLSLALSPTLGLFVAGDFSAAGGNVSAFIAQLAPTCVATAIASGGCSGSGGASSLHAVTLPWAGSTLQTRATGIPPHAIVVPVFGNSSTLLALGAVFQETVGGCDLLVYPDYVRLMLGAGGAAEFDLSLPNTTAIAGSVLHHQVVVAELDSQGAIVEITATNALQLTVGAF